MVDQGKRKSGVVEMLDIVEDYGKAVQAVQLVAIQLGAFIAYDRATEYFTFYDHEQMVRTKNVSTVLLHLVPLCGDCAEE